MSAQNNSMPMFYTSPRPLDRVRDAELRVSRPTSFRFAAKSNAIPLLVDEFPLAAPYYPIVFAAGPNPVPAAVVGLRNDTNLFVNEDGNWLANNYIPAYVRRYPFILMDDPEQKQFVLCLDDSSDMIGKEGEFPLFENDKPSEFTQSAIEFCAALRQQGDATDEFIKALQEHRLLVPNDAQIDMPDGTKLQLGGFMVIDPQKFDNLPDNIFLSWRRKGWIGLIYAHLISSHQWQSLVRLSQERS
ncbi:MAG: SapC family protein [Alphaproteobacteria bacterium]|nr:SapC family protein [Alphaproteobacteria bacterium]